MKIAVLIKQVPDVASLEFDPETRRLKREDVRSEVSSFDIRAAIHAAALGAETGGEVVVMTMGPPQARSALVHCLALGCDRGVHLVDRAFAGADTLATARALARALEREGFDVVLAGRASTDAETAQVGPEVAEMLGIPQVTCVRTLAIDPAARTFRAERETETGSETVEGELPVLVTAGEDLAPERFPKRAERKAAEEKPITEVSAADLGDEPSAFGAAGSPTTVEEIRAVEVSRSCRFVEGEPNAAAKALVDALVERGFGSNEGSDAGGAGGKRPAPVDPDRPVWVVCELLDGEVRRVSLELLAKATELSGDVAAIVLGNHVGRHAALLAHHGASRVLVGEHPALADYATEPHTAVLARAITARSPAAVLFASTYQGQDLAPRVAARLGLGLTGDAIDLSIDGEGRLLQWKPAFGGNIVAPIVSRTRPDMATVRPGVFTPRTVDGEAGQARQNVSVEELETGDLPDSRVRVVERRRAEGIEQAFALDEADVAVGVGKGVGGTEGLARIRRFAEATGAAIAATRDVTDEGWLPRQHQVGLTGRTISPRFYFAVGIRGTFEHTVGIRKAGTIVALNNDPKAPIFEQADFGIVGDWGETLEAITEEILSRRR